MPDGFGGGQRVSELVRVIHHVRNRWRMRLALRGAVIVVVGTLMALFLSASSLQALKFSAASIVSFRIAAFGVFAGLAWYGLVLPLRRRVTDSQVALYLEEHDPTLQSAILSAVESSSMVSDESDKGPSPQLVERLVEQAIERCGAIDMRLGMEGDKVRRHLVALAGVVAAALLLLVFGPAFLRQGMSALLISFHEASTRRAPYHIEVQPGDAKIPRGSDQTVTAKLLGFHGQGRDADGARRRPERPSSSLPLVATKEAERLRRHCCSTSRRRRSTTSISNGVESQVFTMTVLDLPTVDKLVLEYHFPAYTGLAPRTVDPGGDIAAIRAPKSVLKITPTMKTTGGRVHPERHRVGTAHRAGRRHAGRQRSPSTSRASTGSSSMGPHGEKVKASPQYTIDVLTDLDAVRPLLEAGPRHAVDARSRKCSPK